MTSQGWGAQLHCTAEEIGEWPSVMASLCREAHNNTSHFWQMICAKLDTRHRVSSKRHILFGNNVRILLTIFSLEEGNIAVFIPTTSWPPLHTIHPTPVQFSFGCCSTSHDWEINQSIKASLYVTSARIESYLHKVHKSCFPHNSNFCRHFPPSIHCTLQELAVFLFSSWPVVPPPHSTIHCLFFTLHIQTPSHHTLLCNS